MYSKCRWFWSLAIIILMVSQMGCTESNDQKEEDEGQFDFSRALASLTQVDDCDQLLQRIQQDVIAKIDLQADILRDPEKNGYGTHSVWNGPVPPAIPDIGPADNWVMDEEMAVFAPTISGAGIANATMDGDMTSTAETSASQPMDQSVSSKSTSTTGGESTDTAYAEPTGHSDTNVQVEGVDEADIVKLDENGQYIYLLHGKQLFKLLAWPAASLAIEGQADVEGSPREMFVLEDKLAVFSIVYDSDGTLRGEQTDAQVNETDVAPYETEIYYDGMYPGYSGTPFVKISLFDVSGSDPALLREVYVEGDYLSSRRHDNIARVIVQGGFKQAPQFDAYIDYDDAFGNRYDQSVIDEQVKAWRDRVVQDIEGTTLANWLPVERERVNGQLSEVTYRCGDFYVPSPGLTEYGMTNIVAFDMSQPDDALGGAIILGNASQVYASAKVMLLAQEDYSWWNRKDADGDQTVLHRFDLSADEQTRYVASGFVQGHIADQFSMDENQGMIRVTTSRRGWSDWLEAETDMVDRQSPDNRVITLKTEGEELQQVGITEPLGHIGDEVMSTRFVGERGYVVTFRQKDPLIVVDLSDPDAKRLKVLGELEIPGFSDYMHPLGKDHLLTIGRDNGLMLQIFDVSDPKALELTHKYEYSPEGWSAANDNHKAFTYYADKKLLAFPFVNYGYPTFQSSLEVFRVSTDTGFKKLGSISHTDLLMADCPVDYLNEGWFDYYACGRPQPEVRRGLFISMDDLDYVYSISYGGVKVHNITDLAGEGLASVSLPPIEDEYVMDGLIGPVMRGGVTPTGVTVPVAEGGWADPEGGLCGDGVIETGEQCDGTDLGGASCESLGFGTGTLMCDVNCQFDVSMCEWLDEPLTAVCGNGVIEAGEQCDGTDLGGATCEILIGGTGTLSCDAACSYDVTFCDE